MQLTHDFLRWSLPVLSIAFLPALARAQVVLSESFELPDTANFQTFNAGSTMVTATQSWSITTSGVDLYEDAARPEAAAFDGSQAVDLTGSPGAGVMQTTFATVPGATYELIFHYARNNLLGTATGDAQVDVIGTASLLQAAIQHDPATHAFDAYLVFQASFVADSSEATLRFTSLDPNTTGITIDAIQVSRVAPVPSLSTGGLAALAILAASLLGGRLARPRPQIPDIGYTE